MLLPGMCDDFGVWVRVFQKASGSGSLQWSHRRSFSTGQSHNMSQRNSQLQFCGTSTARLSGNYRRWRKSGQKLGKWRRQLMQENVWKCLKDESERCQSEQLTSSRTLVHSENRCPIARSVRARQRGWVQVLMIFVWHAACASRVHSLQPGAILYAPHWKSAKQCGL